MLFTHGNGLNAGMWATVVPHLAGSFHCFGLDFRGHGASRPADEAFSVDRELLVGEVFAAVEELGGAPIVAVGHSLGGATLMKAELARPGTFAGLWLFEPVLLPTTFVRPEGPSLLVQASRRRRSVFGSVEEAYERFRAKAPFKDCEAAAVRAYTELGTYPLPSGEVRLSCSGETEARIFEGGQPTDFADLAACQCPVVVGVGVSVAPGNDIPPLVAPLVAEALGNGRLEPFAGMTHFAPMENGAAVARSISDHLRPLSGGRGF